MRIHTFRLKSGSLLRKSIQEYAKDNNFSAGLVISAVAALKKVTLRMAGATQTDQIVKEFSEDFEVVSIQGTLSKDDCHIHLSLSNQEGKVVGGHLKEGVVGVTAEVSLIELTDRKFLRERDKETGFDELVVKPK